MKLGGFVLAAVAAMVPAVRGQLIEGAIRGFTQRSKSNSAEGAGGADPEGLYERKTQAPMVWLNLHKQR